jgi:guanine deaminase
MDASRHMRRAIELAKENVRNRQGGPFGAVIVRGGQVIAEGTNLVTSQNDPTAHAEVVAIRRACEKLGHFELRGCELYTSCEPCPMCLGAIYWARLGSLFFACTREDAAAAGFDDRFIYDQIPLAAEDRNLHTSSLLRDEGLEAFRVWSESPDRIPY